jgi:uracil-DNA glycosylase
MTSITKCYPGRARSGPGDRVPSIAEQRLCRPWLDAEIALINPKVIVPVGMLAIRLFFEAPVKLEDIVGTVVVDTNGRQLIPLPHPSGASRWHSDPRNLGRVEKAIFQLRRIKDELEL